MGFSNNKNVEVKDGPRGQKVVTSAGRDNSSYGGKGKESFVGGEMGGSADSLDHSIKGAKAEMHAPRMKGGMSDNDGDE